MVQPRWHVPSGKSGGTESVSLVERWDSDQWTYASDHTRRNPLDPVEQ